jgi:protein-disulfide isomerase
VKGRTATLAALGALIVASGGAATRAHHVAARTPQGQPTQGNLLQDPLLKARTKGAASAPITIVEVADFQCPACRMFWAETMPALQREYVDPGKVRLIFVNLPLYEIHKNAAAAHELAMCAAQQGRFWEVHDRLFREQETWAKLDDPSAYFLGLAAAAGLSSDSLDACLASGTMRQVIQREAEAAFNAGVRSTPSFIVQSGTDRGLFPGAAPICAWRPVLDSLYGERTKR